MSSIQTPLVQIKEINVHPNADRLEIVNVLGYQCVVVKGHWDVGNNGIYIPEGAIVPEWILKGYGFWNTDKDKGMLAGSLGNRVKAVRLRDVVSQGIIIPVEEIIGKNEVGIYSEIEDFYYEFKKSMSGEDIAEALKIEKYEPLIPVSMAGDVQGASGHTVRFDIESIQMYPDEISEGELVSITEKLHGTFIAIGYDSTLDEKDFYQKGTVISSKGIGSRGLAFKNNLPDHNASNLYVRAWRKDFLDSGTWDKLIEMAKEKEIVFHLLGEVIGQGVQDLGYEVKVPSIRIFALVIRSWNGSSIDYYCVSSKELAEFCETWELIKVPTLAEIPFDKDEVMAYRDGKSILAENQIREGIVISRASQRSFSSHSYPFLKWVSPDYLTRKGGTEHN